MSTAGPFDFNVSATAAGTGTRNWSTPENVKTSNDSYGQVTNFDDTEISYQLKIYSPLGDMSAIGDSDSVSEVQITVERRSSANSGSRYIVDELAKLIVGGSVTGSDQKDASTHWPTSDTDKTYTFSGLSLTGAQVKASDFGFAMQCICTNDGALMTARVDYVRITQITYTASGTPANQIVNPVQTTINASLASAQAAHAGCGVVGY